MILLAVIILLFPVIGFLAWCFSDKGLDDLPGSIWNWLVTGLEMFFYLAIAAIPAVVLYIGLAAALMQIMEGRAWFPLACIPSGLVFAVLLVSLIVKRARG